jgi:hypothetical protein
MANISGVCLFPHCLIKTLKRHWPKILVTKWRMDTASTGLWQPHLGTVSTQTGVVKLTKAAFAKEKKFKLTTTSTTTLTKSAVTQKTKLNSTTVRVKNVCHPTSLNHPK